MSQSPMKIKPLHLALGLVILLATAYYLLSNGKYNFEELVAGLNADQIKARIDSARLLGELGDRRAVDPLIKKLGEDETNVYSIAEALGKLKDKRAVPPLLSKLYSRQGYVDEIVAWALGEIGDRRALPALKEANQRLDNPQTVEEKRAKSALQDAIHKLESINLQ